MNEHRQYFRIGVERPGRLRHGLESVDCDVLDFTEKGLQVRTAAALHVGEMIQLECRLDDRHAIRCALVVTYARAPYVGGRIISISAEDKQRLTAFVEHSITSRLVGL